MQTASAKPVSVHNPHAASREGGDEPEFMVWITVAVALVLGFFLMFYVTNQTNSVTVGNTTISYPSTWVADNAKGAALAVADTKGGGVFGDRAAVYQYPKTALLPGQGGLTEAAGNWSLQQQTSRVGYRSLAIDTTKVQGKDGVTVEYAYLMDSPYGASAMPALMHGYATIVQSGDNFYVLTYATADPDNSRAKSMNDKLVSSWRVP
jgi:hypothetical protein